jgi:hypothetical protein
LCDVIENPDGVTYDKVTYKKALRVYVGVANTKVLRTYDETSHIKVSKARDWATLTKVLEIHDEMNNT